MVVIVIYSGANDLGWGEQRSQGRCVKIVCMFGFPRSSVGCIIPHRLSIKLMRHKNIKGSVQYDQAPNVQHAKTKLTVRRFLFIRRLLIREQIKVQSTASELCRLITGSCKGFGSWSVASGPHTLSTDPVISATARPAGHRDEGHDMQTLRWHMFTVTDWPPLCQTSAPPCRGGICEHQTDVSLPVPQKLNFYFACVFWCLSASLITQGGINIITYDSGFFLVTKYILQHIFCLENEPLHCGKKHRNPTNFTLWLDYLFLKCI